jgi:CNT family concentrative nucleoside transporter
MAVYVGIFGANAGYILAASIMNAPAALAVSKIIVPETGSPETRDHVEWKLLLPAEHGVVEAAANGALDGMKLAVSIAAILMAFVSLIYMVDCGLGIFGLSFEIIGGYVFAAPAFLMGVPWEDCLKAGNLLALKTVFNEWLAYSRMKELSDAGLISSRTVMIMTYALCSFSNFGSMAILIGGISSLAPERKSEVIQLGMRALLAGLAAGFLTACVAGLLSWD